jgi:multidrug efflux system membrane fusion protein
MIAHRIPRLLSALLLGAVAGCGAKSGAGADAGSQRRLRQAAFPVEVLEVEVKPQEVVIAAPGVVDAFEHIQVTARVSGGVDRVTFVEGQEVKRGQVLAYVDSRRYALNVSSAQASLEKAQATAADAQASLRRRENASASNPGLIPGEELETFRTRLRTAHADTEVAREALKLAQLNLDDSSIKAAVEGVIQTRSVQTGQYVQAGTVIATLLQREPMLLRFSVATAEAPRLQVGMPVEFTLKESQRSYQARITLVGGAADSESRLVPVTAQILATDHKFWLRPGSFAQVHVTLTPQRTFPMIPQTAARPSERGFLAFVVEGGQARERTLQLGMHTPQGWVEVRSGLGAGDLLVTRGLEALSDRAKVRVVQRGSGPSGGANKPAGSTEGAAAAPPMPSAGGSEAPDGVEGRRSPRAAGAAAAGKP